MTGMQWRIWSLAAAGKFFEGFVVFMTGVALPLIVREFHIGAAEKGIVSAASLAGILFGAVLLGGLSDYFGRKRMFIAEMIIFCAFLALLLLCQNFLSLAICLFGLGMALGCDYPTAHMIISESIPSLARGKLVLGAFAFQAIGALFGTGVGCLVLVLVPDLSAWRWMFATALFPAILVTLGRFFIVESPNWLSARGHHEKAEAAVTKLLVRTPQYPSAINLKRHTTDVVQDKPSFWALFNSRNRRATIFASVPWFIQDLGTYGIGIFTPDHPGRGAGRRRRSHPQRQRPDLRRHPGRQGRRADHLPADRRHRLRGRARRQAGPHQAADRRLHRLRRSACCWPRSRSTSRAAPRSR